MPYSMSLRDLGNPGNSADFPSIESFILYSKFNLTPAVVSFNFYSSAFLAVHNTSISQGNDNSPSIAHLPPRNVLIAQSNIVIDEVNANGPTGKTINWKGGTHSFYQLKCGHSHTKLFITGNAVGAGYTHPTNAGNGWRNVPFQVPNMIAGGAPYMPQVVQISGLAPLNVHTTFATNNTGLDFAGYIGEFTTGSGFDSIVVSSDGQRPFPVINLGMHPAYQSGMAGGGVNGIQGCALVVAGSFKKQLSLVSQQFRRLLNILNNNNFSQFVIDLVAGMDCTTTAETCDQKILPKDTPAGSVIEIIIFDYA